MNISALAQVSSHYNEVLNEIAAFRKHVGGDRGTWSDVLAAVLDQLARPALCLLQQRDAYGAVPANAAVGHKLAAGFVGVLRSVYRRTVAGQTVTLSVDSFLDLIDQTHALVGASEVCAGSRKMIRKASSVLLHGDSGAHSKPAALRIEIARALALQIELGFFWELFDAQHAWELSYGKTCEQLVPRSDYIHLQLDRARQKLDPQRPPRPHSAQLPGRIPPAARAAAARALEGLTSTEETADDLRHIGERITQADSAIGYRGSPSDLAHRIAEYLNTYRIFSAEASRLELEMRAALGFCRTIAVRLGAISLPAPTALHWYERIVGQRIDAAGRLMGTHDGLRWRSQQPTPVLADGGTRTAEN